MTFSYSSECYFYGWEGLGVYPGKPVAVKSCIISQSLFLPSDIHPGVGVWRGGGLFSLKNHRIQCCNPEYQ
jgi:hypothetical protein